MPDLNLKITNTALEDMDNIFSYIAEDNRKAASEIIDEFNKAFETLLSFPNRGFVRARYIKREIKVFITAKHYQIVYYVKKDDLFIQRVLTGYQDICAIL